jgi:phage I-like protein
MGAKKLRAFAIALSATADSPPREFRIFKRGENMTMKDERPFIFDDAAALAVMAAYLEHGIDRMIDLEHKSLPKEDGTVEDPDARGWCKLELRDGELWAVNVTWTPDGAARLRDKRQRYISPVFRYNADTLQILSLYNIAICAIPATYEAPPLVAASMRVGKIGTLSVEVKKMDALKAICTALGIKEDSTLEEALSAIKALNEPDDKDKEDPKKKEEAEKASDDPEDKEKMSAALNTLPPKIRGTVMAALVAKDTLVKDIADIKKKQAESEVEALIAANTDRIPLTLEAWARGQSVAVLKAFIAAAPVVPRKPATPPAGGGGNGATATVALTDTDKEYAKAHGIKEADFLASKQRIHDKEQARKA